MNNLDDFLKEAGTVAVAGHIRPDGDCVGSCLAAYNYIKTYYPNVRVDLYLQEIPNIFKFMARSEEILHDTSTDNVYDLFLSLDCGDTGRLGGAAAIFDRAKKTVCVDHHISNQSFADENYVFPEASSTSELIYELLPKERLTKEIAACIYTGIAHDTGVFQYACTSPKTMEAAGTLMGLGIDYTRIVEETFYTKTYAQNQIMACALLKSRLHLDGRCISSVITAEDMRRYGVLPKHLDGIVNQLRITRGVEAAIFLYEEENGDFKVSMRSKPPVNVSEIAVKFGGGGHIRAAGCSVAGDADAIIETIVKEVEERL